ncbi:unnamed protein product [Paramecium sonneborni]|uniref:OTU domain-containing protein n=1 Tax=Paramecium sonneborni TaxID=65129 RepID=A0A8S1MUR4_9CILI|nr:unnamed protein product [Paramecium sonneborni]
MQKVEQNTNSNAQKSGQNINSQCNNENSINLLIQQNCNYQINRQKLTSNQYKPHILNWSISPQRKRYSNELQNTQKIYFPLSNTSPRRILNSNRQNKFVNQKSNNDFSPNNYSFKYTNSKNISPLRNKNQPFSPQGHKSFLLEKLHSGSPKLNFYLLKQQLQNTYTPQEDEKKQQNTPKEDEKKLQNTPKEDEKKQQNSKEKQINNNTIIRDDREINSQNENNIQNIQDIQDIQDDNPPKPYVTIIQQNQDRRMRVFNFLKDLYNKTSGLRRVEEQYKIYIRDIEDNKALKKNYGLKLQNLAFVSQICNAFIQVRGDGNCFYTAFGFQFLYHLLCKYSDDQFKKSIQTFLEMKLRFKIVYDGKQIDDQNGIEKDMLEEFIYIIEMLRQVVEKDRFNQLKQQFAEYEISQNGDAFLYGLQTIFLRNLSAYYLEESEFKDVVYDKENLLIWETECNTNEVIIKMLAQQLQFHVKLLFMDEQVILREYEQQNQNLIILLIKPGHYNIGWNIKN